MRSHVSVTGALDGSEGQVPQGRSYGTQRHVLVDTAGRPLRVRLTQRHCWKGCAPATCWRTGPTMLTTCTVSLSRRGANRRLRVGAITRCRSAMTGSCTGGNIGWLKQCRRHATRFEKTTSSYQGLVMFVVVCHWLQNPFAANVHMSTLSFREPRHPSEPVPFSYGNAW